MAERTTALIPTVGMEVRYVGRWLRVRRSGPNASWATLSHAAPGVIRRIWPDGYVQVEFTNYSPPLLTVVHASDLEVIS